MVAAQHVFRLLVCCLLLSLSHPLHVSSQSCETLSPTSVCAGILSFNYVFIPSEGCQAELEESIETRLFPVLSSPCTTALAQYQCAKIYKPCTNSTLPVPTPVCESIGSSCSDIHDGTILETYEAPTPSCDTTDTVPMSAFFVSTPTVVYGHCETYVGTMCAGVITTPVYIEANMTQSAIEQEALMGTLAFVAAPIANGCQDALYKLFCGHIFPPCVTNVDGHNFSIPFPSLPAQAVCQATAAVCPAELMTPLGLNCSLEFTYASCNAIPNLIFMEYPDEYTGYPGIFDNPPAIVVPAASLSNYGEPSSRCPYPLILPDSPDAPVVFPGAQCVFPCELPAFTSDDWQDGWGVHLAFTTLSFLSTLFMATTWQLFSPDKRGSPTHWILVSLLGLSGATFFASYAAYANPLHGSSGASRFICKNNGQPIRQSDGGGCVFQSIMLIFFGHAAAAWLCASILDVYLVLVYQSYSWTKEMISKKRRIYHIVIWANSLFIIILMLGDSNIGSPHGLLPFCFGSNVDWSWIIEQIHLCAYYAIVPFLISGITVYLRRHINHTLMQAKRSVFREYIRLWVLTLAFAVWLVGVTESIIIFLLAENNVYQTYSTEWAECVLMYGSVNCSRPPYLSKSAWLLMIFALDSFGLFASAIFFSWSDLRLWKKFLIRIKRRLLRESIESLSSKSDNKRGKSIGSDRSRSRESSRSRSREREREAAAAAAAGGVLDKDRDPGMVHLNLSTHGAAPNPQYAAVPTNASDGVPIQDGPPVRNELEPISDAPQMSNSQYERMMNTILNAKGDNNNVVPNGDGNGNGNGNAAPEGQRSDGNELDSAVPLMSTSQYDRMASALLRPNNNANPNSAFAVNDVPIQHFQPSAPAPAGTTPAADRRESASPARSQAALRNSRMVSDAGPPPGQAHGYSISLQRQPYQMTVSHIPTNSLAHEVRGGRSLSDECEWNPMQLALQPGTQLEGTQPPQQQQQAQYGSDPYGLGRVSNAVAKNP